MGLIRNVKDALAGGLFLGLAVLFAAQTRELTFGTAVRMGPGYFPLILSGLMGLFGMIVLVNGLRRPGEAPGGVAWRALAVLTASVVLFGLALHPLGFLPTLASTVFLSTLASRRFHFATALLVTAMMTAFSWLVFILGLGLPLPLLGPWLGGY